MIRSKILFPILMLLGFLGFSQMAEAQLVATNRVNASSADNFGTGAYTSASFTPSANSLVVVTCWAIEETGDTIEGTSLTVGDSITSSFTSQAATATSPGWGYGQRTWTSLAGGSPAARTVNCDMGATNVHAYRMRVDDITGFDTGTPVAGAVVGSDADGDGAASLTLGATPATGDLIYAFAATGTNSGSPTITPGTGFTEVVDATSSGWSNWHMQQVTGVTSTNVPWNDLNAGAGSNMGASLSAIIIRVASGGGGGTGIIKKRRTH